MKKLLLFLAAFLLLSGGTAYAALFPFGVGGTGAGSYSAGTVISTNAANTAFVSTTSPTVGYIFATSTATSTFAGGISSVGLRSSNGLTITGGVSQLGTVQSGTWNGTIIGALYGGTGLNSSASTGIASVSSGTWTVGNTPAFTLGGSVTGNSQTVTGLSQLTVTGLTASSTFSGGVQMCVTNGYCGVGTSTPFARFAVQAPSNNTGAIFAVSSTSNSNNGYALWVNNNGYVAIATTSPVVALDIQGSAITEEGTTTPATNMVINLGTHLHYQVILSGSITNVSFSNFYPGGAYSLNICQGSGGSYTVGYGSGAVQWLGGGTAPTLSTAVGKCDLVTLKGQLGTSTPYLQGGFVAY